MKFYPDISANDQATRIAIVHNFRKWRKEAFGPIDYQAITREQILTGSDLDISRSVIDTQYVIINM